MVSWEDVRSLIVSSIGAAIVLTVLSFLFI